MRAAQNGRMNTYDATMAPRIEQLLDLRMGELRDILRATQLPEGEAAGRDVTDFKDAANDESVAAVDDAQAAHAAAELEQVIAARQRLAGPRYGRCVTCGEAIDLRRLLAVPWTPHCLDCQAAGERRA